MYLLRGSARCCTPVYRDFIREYHEARDSHLPSVRNPFLRAYNFDFSYWNVDYKASNQVLFKGEDNIPFILKPFYYFMATWIAKPLAYPGSTYPINAIMRGHLDTGRLEHMSMQNIVRAKLETTDKNHIDTMFVDNRESDENGKQLVITCEGNAAFYEVGAFSYPLREGYSSLGWNHPGFGYSTGTPFAEADAQAIEAVYQYAVEKLGFAPKDIIIYGWSIGGFASSYIASAHPDIGSLIIDASFDDILPLAIPRMPEFLGSVTVNCCRKYFNLNNIQLITKYPGPVRIIRRNGDEIISTNEKPSGNRGNQLLLAILQSRYPALFSDPLIDDVTADWLEVTSPLFRQNAVPGGYNQGACERQVAACTDNLILGEGLQVEEKIAIAYFLFSMYLTDCEGGHNHPLPRKCFKLPWKSS